MEHAKPLALITGVSRLQGIGYGVARALGNKGYNVIIAAREQAKAETLANELTAQGLTVFGKALDIRDDKSVNDLAQFVTGTYGCLDVLVNNAGAGLDYYKQPLDTAFEVTRAAFETNLFGAWRMIKAFYPLLKLSKHPRIVNISSGAGSFSDPVFGLYKHPAYMTSYGLSKLALNGLTVQFARQFETEGILINAVEPGLTATAPGMEAMGARPVTESVEGIVWAATLPDGGATSGFFRDQHKIEWQPIYINRDGKTYRWG